MRDLQLQRIIQLGQKVKNNSMCARLTSVILFLLCIMPSGLFAQSNNNRSNEKSFDLIKAYPLIKDTSQFIKQLKVIGQLKTEKINGVEKVQSFTKFKITGSANYFYMVELDLPRGTMVLFPWKYHIIFDENGKLIKVLNAIRTELIQIAPQANPFLLAVNATAQGNGRHELYKFYHGKLINVLTYPQDFCIRTYDCNQDEFVNKPYELALMVKDVNNDGYSDILFTGQLKLIMGVSKNNVWYDNEKRDGRIIKYSMENPFRLIPIKLVFIYNVKSGLFKIAGDYKKYCTDNLYKLVYKES